MVDSARRRRRPVALAGTRLVVARSVCERAANIDSVVPLGSLHVVSGGEEKRAALQALTEALVPRCWREVRAPNRREPTAWQPGHGDHRGVGEDAHRPTPRRRRRARPLGRAS
jgi:Pyridoxamine 5'-phosphate oxidase